MLIFLSGEKRIKFKVGFLNGKRQNGLITMPFHAPFVLIKI